MIEVTPVVVAGVAAAAFMIGFVKAGIGGSIGPLVTILAVLVLPVQVALGVLLPLLIVGDALALAALWRRWELRTVGRLLPGAVVGVAAGTYLLAQADSPLLARLLGVLMLLFVAYWVVGPTLLRSVTYRSRAWHGHLTGVVTGVVSSLAHSGGPPVAVYLLLRRTDPVPFVATSALVFAVINLIKVPAYISAGMFDLDLQLRLAWAVAFIPVGIVTGRWLVERIDRRRFHQVSVVLLACSGVYLVVAG